MELEYLREYTVDLMFHWVEELRVAFQQGNIVPSPEEQDAEGRELPLTETESKLDCQPLGLQTASSLGALPTPSVVSSAATSPDKDSSETPRHD